MQLCCGGRNAVTLIGYFDEVGHPSDPNVQSFGIVGCIATRDSWLEFEQTWSATLAEERVTWFHAKELKHGHGEFAGWDQGRRQSFVRRLFEIINHHVDRLTGFSKWLESSNRRRLREEYLQLHEYLLRHVAANSEDVVDFVFARHPEINPLEHHQALREALGGIGGYYRNIGVLSLAEPRTKTPLQAADFIASEVYGWDQSNPRIPLLIRRPFFFRWV